MMSSPANLHPLLLLLLRPPVRLCVILFIAAFSIAMQNDASAHARWVIGSVTPPRTNDTGLKSSPCGGKARTARSTIFSAGQTIDVEFEETVNHPGHYRIAFSPADDMNFDSYILVDNIPDTTNTGVYRQQITIPMNICSACTLQLIQVMTTSATPQTGDFYYSCSDIQITNPGDTTKPAQASNLTAVNGAGSGQSILNWMNPATDFYRVIILKNTSPIFDEPVDGNTYNSGDLINTSEVIYSGNATSFTASALTNDTTYYFKVFSQNPRKNYAAGVETNLLVAAGANNSGGTSTVATPATNSDEGGSGSIWLLVSLLTLFLRRVYSYNQ